MRVTRPARFLLALVALLSASCSERGDWAVGDLAILVPADEDPAVRWAAADLQRLLAAGSGVTPPLVSRLDETDRERLLIVGADEACPALPSDEAYRLVEGAVGGRTALRLCGGGLLGRQYAVYAYLQALGIRFAHPEQTFVPEIRSVPGGVPAGKGAIETPGIPLRGFHLHTQHPIELLEAVLTDDAAEAERAARYVDWLVANRQNMLQWILLSSVPDAEWQAQASRVIDYAHARGVRVFAQSSFSQNQQNAHRLVDPNDPTPALDQLRAGIDELLALGYDGIDLNLGASEFNETDPDLTISWMNEAAAHLASVAPGVPFYVNNHVPAELWVEEYGVNYYDLPAFAEPGVGVYVHTTMLYGLEGPAPVYGNTDFSRQRDFLLDQADERSIVYYPESAWWLTFDNALPLFLPVYLQTRTADLNLVAGAGVDGHVTFTSGWEWGYWLTDLLIARNSWSPEALLEPSLEDLLGPIDREAADRVRRTAEAQWDALVLQNLMPFLSGEDGLTEIAYQAGIVFHPLAPSPGQVLASPAAAIDGLAARLDTLQGHCEALDALTAEWNAAVGAATTPADVRMPAPFVDRPRPAIVVGSAPWREELRDGTAITALRCRNALDGYRALVAARRIELGLPTTDDPTALLAAARASTGLAQDIVTARETAYRYEAARLSAIAEEGAGLDNPTDYEYRVHGRTHRLFFWHRRDDGVERALLGASVRLGVAPQQFLAGDSVEVDAQSAGFDDGTDVDVTWGDGANAVLVAGSGAIAAHAFPAPGQYVLGIDATAEGQAVHVDVPLSAAIALYVIPADSLQVVVPDDPLAANVFAAFVPGLQLGINSSGNAAWITSLARDADLDGEADFGSVRHLPAGTRTGGSVAVSGFTLDFPIESSTGRLGTLFLRDITMTYELTATGDPDDTIASGTLAASIQTEEIVALVVSSGVVDEAGAIDILAGVFDFDPASPPAQLPVELSFSGSRTAALP